MGLRYFAGSNLISTDDAYVNASVAQVTPEIDGIISTIAVHDTQYVRQGQLLVSLNPEDARLDVEAAKAAYEDALRRVQQDIANVNAAKANVMAKEANFEQSRINYERRANILKTGAVSDEDVSTFRNAYNTAKYDLSIAQQQLEAQKAMVKDLDIDTNPSILAAKAALGRAELKLRRTEIRAPVDGLVAQSRVQIGQQIATGASLMVIVPSEHVFVDANFKENQLQSIRVGQPVTLTSDLYGADVVFHGRVEGVGGGTGAAFAVIPAQNATGNWIKVVQRVPVRIGLYPDELRRHPLRVGVSMSVDVSTDRGAGPVEEKAFADSPDLRTATTGSY
jgi:membrane fusion protein (multidrug efflux system)